MKVAKNTKSVNPEIHDDEESKDAPIEKSSQEESNEVVKNAKMHMKNISNR